MANELRIVRVDNEQLSRKTKAALVEIILNNSKDGQPFKLPNEDQLAQMIGVSRNVLRDAMISLEQMGYVTRRRSRGTFANPRIANEKCRLDTDPELCDMITDQGFKARFEMRRLSFIGEQDPVFGRDSQSYLNVEKLFFADDQPVAYCIDRIDGKFVERAEASLLRLKEISYFQFLKRYCNISMAYTMASIDAEPSADWLEREFALDQSEIVIVLEDHAYSCDLDIVGHSKVYFRRKFLPMRFLRKSWK
ncbi:MAG: GntR family transcriptional regulator [Bacillota bacterium]